MKLSVLIPVYNERYLITELINRVLKAHLPENMDRELIIVDDGSTDGTPALIQKLADDNPDQIRYFPQSVNKGKGHAVRLAIEQATGDFCIFQDADLEYDPTDYEKILGPLLSGNADAVFGSRFLSGQRRRVLYFWHSIGNRMLTTLSNIFTDLNLSDMETCYKAFRTEILKTIPIRSNGFGLEPEITAKTAKRGLRVYEVPINYDGRTYAEGKKITWKDGVVALYVILKYWVIDDAYTKAAGQGALTNISRAHRFNAWIAQRITPFLGHRVLEIGAGIGTLTTKFLPRERYIASDVDERHLAILKNMALRRPNLEIQKVDAQKEEDILAFKDDIDTIVCLNALEHIPDDKAAIKNFSTVLKPGGCVVLLAPQGPWLFSPLDQGLEHLKRYSRQELIDAFQAEGFEIEKIFNFNRIGVLGWILNGKILRKKQMAKIQLKFYDSFVWLWRIIDFCLPWRGLSIVIVARKPKTNPV